MGKPRAAERPVTRKKAAAKPSKPTKPGKPAKPAKIKIAVVRALEKCVDAYKEPNDQVAMLSRTLAREVPAAQHGAAAASVLAHTRKGTPVARGYLQALADAEAGHATSAGADVFVRHAATMPRGRRATRDAFAAIWRLAGDLEALEQAYLNYAKTELADPVVLAAGVAVARSRGDHAALAERESSLATSERVRPLVAGLTGEAPARKRAAAQLGTLAPEELWAVRARVVCGLRAFDEALAIEAIVALVDDPRASRLTLSSAIAETRYHGGDELVAAWKQRVAAGDDALVARLIELFDVTSEWATDDDHLEPYIHALYPAGGRPEVFAQVARGLASPNAAVREAICEEWLRESEGRAAFSDDQIDELFRAVVAISVHGDDTNDRRAANRALFYTSHPGSRHALIEALRTAPTANNDKLRWSLYYGLSHIDHPDVVPFAIERLYVEDQELWALLEVFEAKLIAKAAAVHAQTIAALDARRAEAGAARAVTLYADALIAKRPSPRLLIDLAKMIAAWPDPADEQDRRRLRYVLEQATAAALGARLAGDARTFLARARALAPSAYSDYQQHRSKKTTTALAEPATKQDLARLESGELDRAAEAARDAAAAARVAGRPIPADDARLAALATCEIAWRLVTDRATHETWFFDQDGALHVYDGYEVGPAPCVVTGAPLREGINFLAMQAFIAERAHVDERVVFMAVAKKKGGRTREVLRLGDRVLVYEGSGPDYWEQIAVAPVGLAFPDEEGARRVFAMLVANPPDGTASVDPWYVDGKGAVTRKYYAPRPGGGYNRDGDATLAILGAELTGRVDDEVPPVPVGRHADHATAVAALEAWEGELLSARSGQLTKIWIDRSATRREDTVLQAFLDERYRDDTKDAAWHLRGLEDMWTEVVAAGLADQAPDVRIVMGPPASEADIAAYQALVPEPLPAPLLAVWRQVGGGGFATAHQRIQFLAPGELVATREALRARLATYAETRLKGSSRKATLARLAELDVIATSDDAPLILFDTRQRRDDHRCFVSADSDWWESALGWQIATDITAAFKRELERRIGDLFRLRLGQRPGASTRRAHLTKGDRFWEAIVDGAQLMTRAGVVDKAGKASIKQLASEAAAAASFDKLTKAQRAKGYR